VLALSGKARDRACRVQRYGIAPALHNWWTNMVSRSSGNECSTGLLARVDLVAN
jgi:hypothetical protein